MSSERLDVPHATTPPHSDSPEGSRGAAGPGRAAAGRPVYWYYDHVPLALPGRHRYPRGKFGLLRELLQAEGTVPDSRLYRAEPASWALLRLVHTEDYLEAVRTDTLSPRARREIGLPFSPALAERARAAVGATVQAAVAAMRGGAGAILGGGTHHGFADRGAGYCVFNDIAVAVRLLQAEGLARRAAIVDLDVHQGNGSAEIFADDRRVFTFSVHGERNWPHRKAESDMDLGLPDGTEDEAYLAALEPALADALARAHPDVVFYQAGVDALAGDRLGRLALTHEGLRRRDEMVLQWCREHRCPVVVTLGGGYGDPVERTVAAHANTLRALEGLWGHHAPRTGAQ